MSSSPPLVLLIAGGGGLGNNDRAMPDVLIIFITWFAGSAIWLVMQIAVQLLIVRTHEAYKDSRDMVMLGMVGAPVIVFLFFVGSKLWSDDLTWIEVVVWPLVAGWVFVVVLAAVPIAARLHGVLKEEPAK